MRMYERTECQYHPGRPARKAKGLCQTCYARIKRNTDPKWREMAKAANKRYRLKYPEVEKAHAAKYRKTPGGKRARFRQHLKERYGLTEEQYQQMRNQQHNKCALCDKKVQLFVDHCHATGRIRGLLCRRCNHWLGWFENCPTTIEKTKVYLEMSWK